MTGNENAPGRGGGTRGAKRGGQAGGKDSSGAADRVDFKRVAADALQRAEAVLRHWLPNGKRQGLEWVSVNPTRADAKPGSFSVNTVTGAWSDFATGDKGGDLVSLVKYLDGAADMLTAARALAAFCGSSAAPAPAASRPAAPPSPPAVLPVPTDAPKPPQRHPTHGKPSAVWTYRDAAGAVLLHVARFDTPTGKQVLPLTLRRDAGRLSWMWKGLDAPRPLYRLDALAGLGPVLIAEGEKAADAAARLLPGFIASTSPNGSSGAGAADWSPLAGRRVVIWRDHDAPGERYAADVKRLALQAGAASVRVAELAPLAALRGAELPAGFDAADAEAEGLAASALADWLAPLAGIGAAAALAPPTAPAGPLPDSSGDGSGGDDPPSWLDDGDAEGEPEPEPAADAAAVRREPGFFTSNGADGRPAGVWFQPAAVQVGGKWKEAPAQWVCGPIVALHRARAEDGGDWSTVFAFTAGDGARQSVMIRSALFARASGDRVFEMLLARGLALAPPGDPVRPRVLQYLLKVAEAAPVARLVYRCGWHADGRCYVAGPETIIGKPPEPLVLSPEVAPVAVTRQGLPSLWKTTVCKPLAGHSRPVLAVSAAFGALALGRLQEQGFGLHLVGASSAGKSTVLKLAASVFGGPDWVKSWRATGNALEAVAAAHSDALLILDELKELQAAEAGTVAYLLANGAGKARLRDDGSQRTPRRWRTLFLSSGEIGLADHAASVNQRSHAGQEVRCIEIGMPAGPFGIFDAEALTGDDSAAFRSQLEAAALAHCGHAWRPFVEALAADPALLDGLRKRREEYTAELLGTERAGAVHRVAFYLALVAAAGDLAGEELGLTGWPAREAFRAAAVCFRDWLQRRGGGGSAEARAMVEQVQHFITLHREGRFTDLRRAHDDHRPKTLNEAGFRYYANEAEPPEYWIHHSIFKSEVCKGNRWQDVAGELLRRGLLKPEADGGDGKAPRFDRNERVPGVGRIRVVRILPGILEATP